MDRCNKSNEQLGSEKVKTLIGFQCFGGYDTVEKFTRKSKDTWTKSYLNSDLRRFNYYLDMAIHNNKVYSKKALKLTILQNCAEIYT